MDKILYKLMNWPEIESIIYSECDHPHELLGKHTSIGGSLIQCYFPGAVSVKLIGEDFNDKDIMEMADEDGFFAYWTLSRSIGSYQYEVTYSEGTTKIQEEVYSYLPKPDKAILDKLAAGTLYDMYNYLGAHECSYKEKNGVSFMVYAPGVQRVSVVGDFNNWDGRMHQMSRITESGLFSVFIPGLSNQSLYKYEFKLTNGLTYLKRDPFSFYIEEGGNMASLYNNEGTFRWSDTKYMTSYNQLTDKDKPLSLGEICLSDFKNLSSQEMLKKCLDYVKENHFSALVLDNISKDHSNNNIYCLYSQSDIKKSDLKYLINGLHENSVPVLFTIDYSAFMPDNEGLKGLSGAYKLYEALDDREIDSRITFNFGNSYVCNYLISNAFYYVDLFHADGFVFRGTDRILYLNYKIEGEDYNHNIYGGNENLEGEEFIKHLNSILHKRFPEIITIAGDSLSSNNLTKTPENGGLGFDFKFDNYFHAKMLDYFKSSQDNRKLQYNDLVNLLVNAFCEDYILMLPRHEYGADENILINEYSGSFEEKYSNFRLMLATFYCFPGRKSVPFINIKDRNFKAFLQALQNLYTYNSALFENEADISSFKWINNMDPVGNSMSFLRISEKEKLLIVCNFSDEEKEMEMSVDEPGDFREIFNSNLSDFGGNLELDGAPVSFALKDSKEGKDTYTAKVCAKPLTLHVYTEIVTYSITDFEA